jgi:glycosyltransferase involved in cell wall biosynthesis
MALNSSIEKINVAIVAPTFRYVGGVAVQAGLLLRLWERDPDIKALFVPMDTTLPSWGSWLNGVPGLRTLIRSPFYWAHLWREFGDTDVAHVFGTSYWSFLISAAPAWLIGRFRGKKVLLNYHNGHARDHLMRFRTGRFVLSRSDEVVVPSQYLSDVLEEFGMRAAIIPNLVDLMQFRYRLRSPLRPRFICSRGFGRDYRIDTVVRAFSRVRASFPNATIDLLGEGPLESEIRQLVSSLRLEGVRFTGVVSRDRIGDYYDDAHIFINASSVDAMPGSVIEAFRAGTPVVSTSPEAMPYLVDHGRTGLLSAVGDDRALAENAIRLLHNSQLAQSLSVNAYQESHKYEWKTVRDKWVQLYRELSGISNVPLN